MANTTVASIATLQSAINAAAAGDVITMTNGTYNVTAQTIININGINGASGNPVTIKAETDGGVIFTSSGSGRGAFQLQNSSYITIRGFVFRWQVMPGASLVVGSGHDYCFVLRGGKFIVITRNWFEPFEPGLTVSPGTGDTYPYWLYMDSVNNGTGNQICSDIEISYNRFNNKVMTGSFIVSEGDKGTALQAVQRITIKYNYFSNIINESVNGAPNGTGNKEAIRLGSSSISASNGDGIIEFNLFENCDGEDENISIKCGNMMVRYNTIKACYGCTVLRHGNGSTVHSNFFLGEYKIGTGGVRILGDNHIVYNNYFEKLDGRNFTSPFSNSNAKPAICLQMGDTDLNGNVSANNTNGCDNALIVFNTFYNCLRGIKSGFDGSGTSTRNVGVNGACKIEHNVFRLIKSADKVLFNPDPTTDDYIYTTLNTSTVTFTNNVVYSDVGRYGAVSGDDTALGGTRTDPLLDITVNGILGLGRLTATSPSIGTVADGIYTYVVDDVEGRTRVSLRDGGCNEFVGTSATRHPLDPTEVGPAVGVVIPTPPPPGATVAYSGGVIKIQFEGTLTVGSGTITIRINGGSAITCPRWFVDAKYLFIRIPDANKQTTNINTIDITLPAGLILIDGVASAAQTNMGLTNNTGVEGILPLPGLSAVELGTNLEQPEYFTRQAPWSNVARVAAWERAGGFTGVDGIWDDGSPAESANHGNTVTVDANQLPSASTLATTHTYVFRDGSGVYQTGTYTVRWQGAGSVALANAGGTAFSLTGSGTNGAYSYREYNVNTTSTSGFRIVVTPPITALEVLLPGYSTAGSPASSILTTEWSTKMGIFTIARHMDTGRTNNSNLVDFADRNLPGSFTYVKRHIERSATVSSQVTSTSVFHPSGTIYEITHNGADIFVTGQTVSINAVTYMLERSAANKFKITGGAGLTFSGTILLQIDTALPYEAMIDECNLMGQDLWICVPHLATDAFVSSLANLIRDSLLPWRKCYVEYSNECWNSIFRQYTYCQGQGLVAAIGSSNFDKAIKFYARRSAQVHELFRASFATKSRAGLVKVLAHQSTDYSNTTVRLNEYLSYSTAQAYPFTVPDVSAIAPYFGTSINQGTSGAGSTSERKRDFYMNGSSTKSALDALQILDLVEYLQAAKSHPGIDGQRTLIDIWNAANSAAVKLVAYEGGQHLDGADPLDNSGSNTSADGGTYNSTDEATWDTTLAGVNRHPRMAYLYWTHLNYWLSKSGSQYVFYNATSRYIKSGYWGLLEYMTQPVGRGDGLLSSHDNRTTLSAITGNEAVKLYALTAISTLNKRVGFR